MAIAMMVDNPEGSQEIYDRVRQRLGLEKPAGAIFVKRHVGPSGYHDEVFHDDEHVVRTLTKLLDDASTCPAVDRVRRPTRLGQDDAALVHGRRARSCVASGRRRGGLRGRRARAQRRADADAGRTVRPARGGPAATGRRIPPHGGRRRHRRGGPRSGRTPRDSRPPFGQPGGVIAISGRRTYTGTWSAAPCCRRDVRTRPFGPRAPLTVAPWTSHLRRCASTTSPRSSKRNG